MNKGTVTLQVEEYDKLMSVLQHQRLLNLKGKIIRYNISYSYRSPNEVIYETLTESEALKAITEVNVSLQLRIEELEQELKTPKGEKKKKWWQI